MKSIALESEHFVLLGGGLFILMGLLWTTFFTVGVVFCILSYAIDLVKRIKEEDV